MHALGKAVRGIGMEHLFPPEVFADETLWPTVQAVVCHKNKVIMTRSAFAPKDVAWWILPQESIEQKKDATLAAALTRGLHEELGIVLTPKILKSAQVLFSYDNPLPRSRMGRGARITKHMVAVGISVPDPKIVLDAKENCDYRLISSWEELDEAMASVAEERLRKYVGTCQAVSIACHRGLLSWGVPGLEKPRKGVRH